MSKVLVDRYMLEQVSKAAEAFYSLYKRTIVSGCVPLEVLDFAAARASLRAALDISPQSGAVAEVIESHAMPGLNGRCTAEVSSRDRLSVGTELFLHPASKLEPLADELIQQVWLKWVGTQRPNYSFVRAIEREHGIDSK